MGRGLEERSCNNCVFIPDPANRKIARNLWMTALSLGIVNVGTLESGGFGGDPGVVELLCMSLGELLGGVLSYRVYDISRRSDRGPC